MIQKTVGQISNLIRSEGFRKYFSNTSWLVGEKVLTMGLAFIVSAIVTRYLGPDNRGLLDYGLSVVSFLACLIGFGISDVIVRYLVNEPEKESRIIGTSFFLWFLSAMALILLVVPAMFYFSNDTEANWIISIILTGHLFQSFNVINYYFDSQVKSKYGASARLIQFAVSSAIKLVLVFLKAPLLWFAAVFIINDLSLALGLIFNYHRLGRNIFKWRFDLSMAPLFIKESLPLLFAALMITIYMKVDQVMIKHLLNNAENGIYSVAARLTEIWNFIPVAIGTSLFPALLGAKKVDEEKYMNRLQSFYTFMVVFAICLGIGMSLIGEPLIVIVYGEAFRASATVLVIQIWSSIFTFIGMVSYYWIIAENLQKYSFIFTVFGAVVNVGLNFWLIPILGIQGAALATLASQLTSSYLVYAIFKETRMVFRMKTKALFMIDLAEKIRTGTLIPK